MKFEPDSVKAGDRFIRYYLSELVDMIDRGPAAIQIAIDEGEHKNFLHALDLARELFSEKCCLSETKSKGENL